MNKFFASTIALLLIISMAACTTTAPQPAPSSSSISAQPSQTASTSATEATMMKPGTYATEARGFVGNIKVETQVDDSKILSVKVLENKETNGIGSFAVERIPDRIVETQSIGIDVISGATISSRSIIYCVSQALKEASADMAKFETAPPKPAPKDEEFTTDIIIVGAGGAGLTAGVEAINNNKNAIVVEKMDIPGGNTIRSSGEFNVAGSKVQTEAKKGRYSIEDFIKFTMTGGHDLNNPELVRYMITNSASVVDWLNGQEIPAKINETYNSYYTEGYAKGLVLNLAKRFESLGGEIKYSVRATDIIMEDGKAVGIIATSSNGGKVTIRAKAVVIASGGFGGDLEMCVALDPNLKGFVTDNGPGATGDGIKMAEAIGAGTVDMEQIQSHPTIQQATSIMLTEGIRNSGGILLNTSGKRFTNEVNYRDVVSAAILDQDQKKACIVFNQDLMNGNENVQGYKDQGLLVSCDTYDDIAKYIGVDAAVVKETMDSWNKNVADKNDPEFSSAFSWVRDLGTGPYYVTWVAPGIHHTMGGIKINVKTEVVSKTGEVIPGLFACGEVTGGIHGGNRIGGNAILDILIFGRVAGDSSAEYIGG